MFIRPKELIQRVLSGSVDYDSLPYDENNEVRKGYGFESQAKVNLSLYHHEPFCIAFEGPCKKEGCILYTNQTGRLKNGWACREFQVDYPSARFDQRFHVTLIGESTIDAKKTKANIRRLAGLGAMFICLGCLKVYQAIPEEVYQTGSGPDRYIKICKCGSDIFDHINKFLERLS